MVLPSGVPISLPMPDPMKLKDPLKNSDYIRNYLLFISIALPLILFSCSKFDVDEAVDQRYLDTPAYQRFRETSRSETLQSIREKKQLEAFVKRAVKQRGSADSRSIPFVINAAYIDRLLKNEEKETALTTTFSGGRQRIYYLAKAGDNSLGYHFFLLCKVSAYKNCAIGLATMDSGRTVDLDLIAPFKRMLTYDEVPTLKITPQEINIEITTQLRYPIEQQNVYGRRYVISAKGTISEVENR
jgi:hypothetical protein